MKPSDKPRFLDILRRMMNTYGVQTDPDVIDVWWHVMDDMSIEQFSQAASDHVRMSRFRPVPADIRDLAGVNRSEWPSPEEAWNALPKSEDVSGWMFQEMATAMGACWDSLQRGDMIGARMAFIEVYKREIQGKRGKPEWWISPASLGSYESRLRQEVELLEQHPQRRLGLLEQKTRQLEAMTGSQRVGSGLQRLGTDSTRGATVLRLVESSQTEPSAQS